MKLYFYEVLEAFAKDETGELAFALAEWDGKFKMKLQRPSESSKMTIPYLYVEGEVIMPYVPANSDMFLPCWEKCDE